MSRVTNVILTAMFACKTAPTLIEYRQQFLHETDSGYGKFVEVTEHAGGIRYVECRVYLSAFNHADTDTILRTIDQAPWRDKEIVQVFVKEQEEEVFRLRYTGGRSI